MSNTIHFVEKRKYNKIMYFKLDHFNNANWADRASYKDDHKTCRINFESNNHYNTINVLRQRKLGFKFKNFTSPCSKCIIGNKVELKIKIFYLTLEAYKMYRDLKIGENPNINVEDFLNFYILSQL